MLSVLHMMTHFITRAARAMIFLHMQPHAPACAHMHQVILNNVYSMLDQISVAVGSSGAPSTSAVACLLFSLLLVNSVIYCFLLHVVYRLILQVGCIRCCMIMQHYSFVVIDSLFSKHNR